MQNDAAEIKLRAERRAGEMLKEGAQNGHRQTAADGRPKKVSNDTTLIQPVKLREIGLTRDQSSQWQSIAEIPEEDFERTIKETKQSGEELTQRDILKVAKEIKEEKNKIRRAERIENIIEVSRNNTVLDGSIGRFPLIYADPPWPEESHKHESRAINPAFRLFTR
jgi:hypothetical protein